ncbi:hypothetical protein KC317_g22705 [Hortaea werneckii]|nr:hypothetical protein KC317_g22705 [Hortaea werneckii]
MSAEPPASVSNTRLYLGNLPRNATKADVENHFNTHGTGEITEIKLMNGFGFIEYKDSMDARDVVPAFRTLNPTHTPYAASSCWAATPCLRRLFAVCVSVTCFQLLTFIDG